MGNIEDMIVVCRESGENEVSVREIPHGIENLAALSLRARYNCDLEYFAIMREVFESNKELMKKDGFCALMCKKNQLYRI